LAVNPAPTLGHYRRVNDLFGPQLALAAAIGAQLERELPAALSVVAERVVVLSLERWPRRLDDVAGHVRRLADDLHRMADIVDGVDAREVAA